jgi:hypothetical protein
VARLLPKDTPLHMVHDSIQKYARSSLSNLRNNSVIRRLADLAAMEVGKRLTIHAHNLFV